MMLSSLAHENIGRHFGDDVNFESLSTDTRTLKPGQLFVALRGEHFDAHTLLENAEEKGACAIVVEREVDTELPQLIVKDTTLALGEISAHFRKEFSGQVVAVTGSSGKTTVKGMLHSVLSKAGRCLATQGNYNNHIGVPLTLARLNNDYDYAVVEAGMSNPGEISYLANLIQPNVALVTNVQEAHIGQFATIADVAKEKTQIYLSSNAPIAVVNLDDAEVLKLLPLLQDKTIIGFSESQKVRDHSLAGLVYANDIALDQKGCATFSLVTGHRQINIRLAVPGKHNVSNALAVAAAAIALDIELEKIKSGLEGFSGVAGRMEILDGPNDSVIVNDTYNANPGSLKAAIDYLSNFENSLLVCGDMAELGESSMSFHRDIGKYAKEKGIKAVYTVGNDSLELSRAFGNGQHFESKEHLLSALEKNIQNQSVVLVKGSRSAAMESVVEALSKEVKD